MSRMSLRLSNDLATRLDREASRSHRPRSAVVRVALAEYLPPPHVYVIIAEYVRSALGEDPGEVLARAEEYS